MRSALHNRSWLYTLLVATFFLCARAGSVAHAANYGSAPHNHDSKICMLSIMVNEDDTLDDIALPPEEISLNLPVLFSPVFAVVNTRGTHSKPVNASARGPPAK